MAEEACRQRTEQELPAVLAHEICVFYPFTFEAADPRRVRDELVAPLTRLTVADIVPALPIRKRQKKTHRANARPVWVAAEPARADDFHPHMRRVLEGPQACGGDPAATASRRFRGMPPLELSDAAQPILANQKYPMRLTTGAAENAWVACLVAGARVHAFGTGIGMLEVRLTIGGAGAGEGQPGLVELAKAAGTLSLGDSENKGLLLPPLPPPPNPKAVRKPGDEDEEEEPPYQPKKFHLTLAPLFPGLFDGMCGSELRLCQTDRLFTLVCVKLESRFQDEHQRGHWAYLFSRAVATDNEPTSDERANGLVRLREYVTHAVALEGGAIIVEPNTDGAFSKHTDDYLTNSFARHYRRIALAAYQEYEALHRMADLGIVDVQADLDDEEKRRLIERLSRFQKRLLDFRLNSRFTYISRVSLHNQVFLAWRKALGLDAMLAEVTADVREVEAYLSDEAREKSEEARRKSEEARQADARRQEQAREADARRLEQANITQTQYGIAIGGFVLFTGIFGMNLPGLDKIGWDTALAFCAALMGVFGVLARNYGREALSGPPDQANTGQSRPGLVAAGLVLVIGILGMLLPHPDRLVWNTVFAVCAALAGVFGLLLRDVGHDTLLGPPYTAPPMK